MRVVFVFCTRMQIRQIRALFLGDKNFGILESLITNARYFLMISAPIVKVEL